MKNITKIAFAFAMITILPACFGSKKKAAPANTETVKTESVKKVIGDKEDYAI